MTRRASAVASTRERIVLAAIELYRAKGFRSTTVAEVAERADVARATLLNHFPGRGALASAAVERIMADLDLPSAAIFDGATTRAERLRRLVRALFAVYDRGEPWFKAFGDEIRTVPALRRNERGFWEEVGKLYGEALGPQMRDRRFRATVVGLTSPATFSALKESGLTTAEAGRVVGDLLARLSLAKPAAP